MKSHRIRDICQTYSGGTPSRDKEEYYVQPPNGHPWLASRELNGGKIYSAEEHISEMGLQNSSAKYFPKDTVLIAMYGATAGRVGVLGAPMTTSQAICGMMAHKELCSQRFLYYLICNESWKIVWENALGAAQPNISQQSILRHNVELPSTRNQEKILKILDPIEEGIELNQKISIVLNQKIQSLFRSWFIDFDPVKAKIGGKLPYGMDEETAALFPYSFEDSELGPIPTGWNWGKLGDCISVVGGGTPSTKNEEFWDGEYNWTSPKDLSNSNSIIMLDTERTITEAGLAKVSSGLLPENTVLMSSRAPIGYLALTKIPVAINQGYIAIPPKNSMSPNFMLSWIHFNMPLIEAYSSGSTFPEISKKEFRKLPILIPPAELIEKFNEKTTRLYDSMETSLKQMNSLISTRDALLPRMMSGELSVS